MHEIRHPLTGAVYGLDDGLVRVERSAVVGWFGADGQWLRGELRTADPELCRWVMSRSRLPAGSATRPAIGVLRREAT